MKFARYLEDTQTPEWHRAYINYRLLKKRIKAIRPENAGAQNIRVESPISTQINSNQGMASEVFLGQSAAATNSLHPTISLGSGKNLNGDRTNASFPDLLPSSSVAEQPQRREPLYRSRTLPASGSINSQKPDRGRAPSFSRMFSSSNSKRRFTQLALNLNLILTPNSHFATSCLFYRRPS
ncbi:hypothetical protein C8R44DRAFT_292732 [Mycena epipterygia]|nr:hypothetical protein C8R44DRAFT_292732 [Mycena epipterygia]